MSTYSGRVLVGFWLDKLQIESEKRARQAERRARGELPYQRKFRLVRAFTRPVPIPRPPPDKRQVVEYGQPVLLQAPEVRDLGGHFVGRISCPDEPGRVDDFEARYGLRLAATASELDFAAGLQGIQEGCPLACTSSRQPEVRSVFRALSCDAGAQRLEFGTEFFLQLAHADGPLFLRSEPPLLDGQFGPNYHYPVRLSTESDCYAKWRILHWDRNWRFESKGAPVPPCMRIIIQHVMTNQCLAVEKLNWHRSLFGFECGVSAYTYSDVHRNETSECIWNIIVEAENYDDEVDLTKCN